MLFTVATNDALFQLAQAAEYCGLQRFTHCYILFSKQAQFSVLDTTVGSEQIKRAGQATHEPGCVPE